MNEFVTAFTQKLNGISTQADVENVYKWIWENQGEVERTAHEINADLRLRGKCELKPDLPCLTVGSHSGLVVVAANPGWKPDGNPKEDDYCRKSCNQYVEMMSDFFRTHPKVTQRHSSWWYRAMNFVPMLPGEPLSGRHLKSRKDDWKEECWEYVHHSKQLGGWDLFPWHSSKDGVSRHLQERRWLGDFCCASVEAAIRLGPKLLFVVSKNGYDLVRHNLLMNKEWCPIEINSRSGAKAEYTRLSAGTEIVVVNRQILAGASRGFRDVELIAAVRKLRGEA